MLNNEDTGGTERSHPDARVSDLERETVELVRGRKRGHPEKERYELGECLSRFTTRPPLNETNDLYTIDVI